MTVCKSIQKTYRSCTIDNINIMMPKSWNRRSIRRNAIKKGVLWNSLIYFRVRCLSVELPLVTQSSHEVDLLVPSTL